MLPTALSFTDLPSDRNGPRTRAGRLLHELAENALFYGMHDRPRYAMKGLRERVRDGRKVTLCFDTRPGAFIERRPDEERDLLRELTSADGATLGVKEEWLEAWDPHSTTWDAKRTTWRIPGCARDRR